MTPVKRSDLPPEPAHIMLRHCDRAALFVGVDAACMGIEHSQHRVARENLTPPADGQGFALHGVVSAAAIAPPP